MLLFSQRSNESLLKPTLLRSNIICLYMKHQFSFTIISLETCCKFVLSLIGNLESFQQFIELKSSCLMGFSRFYIS